MFTHLHVHTEYSLLDGCCRIEPLISEAKNQGMKSLAITDHGNMYGIVDFYRAAKNAGIKPIIGCEVYVAPNSRTSKSPNDKGSFHLTLLAKSNKGYHNLLKLVTAAHLEGFYYKPRTDKELLSRYSDGIIALSGCLQGPLSRPILEHRMEDAINEAKWYRKTFEDFYIEIQRHPIPELEQVNKELVSMSSKLNIPMVATNDVHYITQKDASMHELLLCIQTNTSIKDPKRMKMAGDFFYLKSPEEMIDLFKDLPEAIANTDIIADKCDVEIEFGKPHLPKVSIPENQTSDQYLAQLCREGLLKRYASVSPEVEKRLVYELDVIRQTNFADYFLVVWDLISFVREKKIYFGVRGSAAASLVLYCLGITDIDPLEHKLVFERFLNIERREMPDIDLDFQDDRRNECLAYVSKKYGPDHVAQIITFGTLGARAAVRDVGRALGQAYSDVDRVARLIPARPNIKLDDALNENRELMEIYNQDSSVKNLFDSAKRLEGISRHASTHAAGVVISSEPLTEYLPLIRSSKDEEGTMTTTQLAMENVAMLGLLKMDFLGLANLTLLSKAKATIAASRHLDMDLQKIPLTDPATYKLLSSGETSGVFQLEGDGMRRNIKELKPTVFGDIAAMVALYRPGPMQHIPTFINSKHGLETIHFPHPILKNILEDTYGVIVYQDQVLLIVQALAKYSLGQADIFRKAMGKKKPEVMAKEKDNFLKGAVANGVPQEKAEEVFSLIEPFAGYAFNKAHAVSYAKIAYETAYLKANFPVEFMTALLNTYSGNADKIRTAVSECRRLNIPVLPPDINKSFAEFAIESFKGKLAIRFSLTAIKNVSNLTISDIIETRKIGGQFKSLEDFCRRADLRNVNKKVLESLIKAGAFDEFASRTSVLLAMNQIVSLSQREKQLKDSGQSSMFDLWGASVAQPLPDLNLDKTDTTIKEKLVWEKELLGVYFSEHPLNAIASNLAGSVTTFCGQITSEMVGQQVVIAGLITTARELTTRDGRPFIIATLEDLDGFIEVTAWSDVYARDKELWKEGEVLLVEGKIRSREDKLTLSCVSARKYEIEPNSTSDPKEAASNDFSQRKLFLTVDDRGTDEDNVDRINKIMDVINSYPGEDIVDLEITTDEETTHLELPPVKFCEEVSRQLTAILGHGNLRMEISK